MAVRSKLCIYIGVGLAFITVAVVIFDLITDWIALGDCIRYDGGKMTVALGIFCVIDTVLFAFEIRNGVVTYRLAQRQMAALDRDKNDESSMEPGNQQGRIVVHTEDDPEETRLELWKEVLSFLLLVLEDIPVTVIIYVVFRSGPCPLYTRLFRQSFTAYLSLLGSIISAVWKALMAFVYCCRLCRCQFRHVKGVCAHLCCCCCRLMRPMVAFVLLGFTAYLYSTYSEDDGNPRPECTEHATTLVSYITTSTIQNL